MVLFIAGVCIGASVMRGIGIEKEKNLVDFFALSVKESAGDFWSSYKSCLITNLKYICAYFFLSLNIYSAWVCTAISGVKGFTSGFTAMFLIRNYGSKGVIYTILAIAPSSVLIMILLIFASVVCVNFALERHVSGEKGARAASRIIPGLFVIYTLMAVFSLYDGLVSSALFGKLF